MLLLLTFSASASSGEKKENTESQQSIKSTAGVVTDRPWWLGDLITVLGIFAGAGMIIWQLGRQHKNELKIQKENCREQLRLEIYQEFSKTLEEASEKNSDVGMYAFLIPMSLNIYINQIGSGFNPVPVMSRAIEFSNKHSEASSSIIKLIRLFEKYEIISPELEIFKLAINVAIHDMEDGFNPLHSFLLQILPMDIVDSAGDTQLANIIIPTQEQMNQLDTLVSAYKSAADDLSGYLYDLNIEIQGMFLGRLFDNKIKKRVPIDPKIKVVTTEPEEMRVLKKYFEEETAWGKSVKRTEEGVKSALKNK